jgi:hypothetical protein
VIGTPNWFHFYDSQSALMPFFYWLPEELAMQYCANRPRPEFRGRFGRTEEPDAAKTLEFARWGRGMGSGKY